MKAIHTKNWNGKARATDNDGNTANISSSALSYDQGHKEAAFALCKKMGWYGELIGAHVLRRGQNVGMVWVWVDPASPRIVHGQAGEVLPTVAIVCHDDFPSQAVAAVLVDGPFNPGEVHRAIAENRGLSRSGFRSQLIAVERV